LFFKGLSSPLNSRSEFIQKDVNISTDPLLTDKERGILEKKKTFNLVSKAIIV